ncbi:asparagine synthase (glutamine-hydrolyzing) [Poseidonibacter lekithochrous]|uniref:asparagine synthase (glutamine-hydrolyzing) n=1 Tax=Poseidonibacter lekithochrous TaxID=1904463 RepID=UPI000D337A64|nr:asparagine synthase (glutamine-hydrolyzing) [Poseidonibacter lekithochrous]
MCGFIGSITKNKLSDTFIEELNNLQHHRGPDGNSFYRDSLKENHITLLHQRLSIIDLADGSQPMINMDKDTIIVFNGEIFNHQELRRDLISKGYEFSTNHSDTEVLLYMYTEYKEKMLLQLNGMFSFIIYDKNNNQLFGARDRTGIKPLYYSFENNQFYFASELKTLLKFGLKKEINLQSVSDYLSFQFVPAPNTIFKNINKLESANYFIFNIEKNHLNIKKYWDLDFSEKITDKKEAILRIREQFSSSVKLWSLSDVEVGASLSGGLDSTSIVANYSKFSENRIKTYTLGFEGNLKNLDERKYANLVAKKYNTQHSEFILTEKKLLNELDDMIYHLDEPYAGGLPSWYIYKMMKGDVKVALTGSGGDELFGNYNKSLIYNSKLIKLKKVLSSVKGNGFTAMRNYIKYPKGFFYHKYFRGDEINNILLTNGFRNPEKIIENLIVDSSESDYKNIVPYIDFKMQLPEEFLNMTDKFSMAHSIEARVPFLDPNMIKLVMSIDSNIRIKHNDPKYLLKESFKDLIPSELINKPKSGFIVPEAEWIKTILKDKVEYFLGEEYLIKQNIFNKNIYKEYVIPHMKGNKDNHWQIWTLLMFQLWYEQFMEC